MAVVAANTSSLLLSFPEENMLLLFTPPRLVPTRKRGCVQRYRICVEHRDAMSVVLKGQEQRFCQQVGALFATFSGESH